jgi:iron(III) transport system ATP-binding protein
MGTLQLEGLTLRYAGRDAAAVRDLDLSVDDGEYVVLVGPSGCGKSTTLRLIAGFLRPDAGRILVDGAVLSDRHRVVPPERRNMGMVFQSFAIWPHLSVFDNVAFGLIQRRLPAETIRDRVRAMLEIVDIASLERAYPSQLSGGQQQRVALARSLVVEPRTLLLDEPLSSLDAKLRERMCSELKELQRRTGVTFVHVTHDQSEAIAIADRIAVMHEGRIEQFASAREVYLRPASRVVADAMGAVNLLEARVVSRDGSGAAVRLFGAQGPVMQATVADAVVTGSMVLVAVRPEDVTMARAGGGTNAIVEEATFRGAFAEHIVAIGAERVRVQTLGRELFEPGSSVKLTIDGARCVVLP